MTAEDFEKAIADCREAIAVGGVLRGKSLRNIIDCLQAAHGASGDLVEGVEAQLAIWDGAKGGASADEYAAAVVALTPLLAAAEILSDAVIAVDDVLDGRP